MAFKPAFQISEEEPTKPKEQRPEKPSGAAFNIDEKKDTSFEKKIDLPGEYDEYEEVFNHLLGMGEVAQKTIERGEKVKKHFNINNRKKETK